MNYYSDPTSSAALGNIGRELSRHEKEAKKLLKLFQAGKISRDELEKMAQAQFTGIFRHVLSNVEAKEREKRKQKES